jgi:hypothetical protein
MIVQLSSDQQEFRDTVRDFVSREIRPLALHPDRLQSDDPQLPPSPAARSSARG